MKNIVKLTILVSLISACSPLRFDSMPGEKSKEIPPNLLGNYIFKDATFFKQDSFLVKIDASAITIDKNNERNSYFIDNDFFVHSFNDYFVFGKYDDEFKKLYNIIIVEPSNGDIKLYGLFNNFTIKQQPTTIEKYLPKKQSLIDNFQVETPSPSNLLVISAGAEPSGQVAVNYYGMDNFQFENFINQELKNLRPIILYNTKKTASKKK